MLKKCLFIFFLAMVPIIELRGSIPVSVAWDMPTLQSFIICVIGNMIPVPFIFWFARKVLEWGKDKRFIGKFFTWCLEKGKKGGQKLTESSDKGIYIALMLFVGIPLPGTGAWTGTLAASFLDLDWKKSVISVMLGVVIAGVIMYLASLGLFGAIGHMFSP